MSEQTASAPDYSILAQLDQGIRRPKASFFYHCGLVLVAGTMIILPVIYLALVGASAFLVFYHATHNWKPIMDLDAGTTTVMIIVFKFLIYFAPLCAGLVMVFFLFKPIFARRPKFAQPLALNPATEPLLYAFVEKIAATVGAPSPKRIDLDCQLNAAAALRRGWFSFFGNDLVLVLGLPLVANLNTQELTGVVAHEFGHFTQSAGMRLTYVIRSINMWFARVVYQRDRWDAALEELSANVRDWRAAMIIWTVHLGVGLSRLFLRILMYTGHFIGGFMLRQMEYNADAYQIKLAGSETFESTQRKLAVLDAALQLTYRRLKENWKKYRTLPDNLPEVLRRESETLPPQLRQQIDDTVGLRKTGLFDSHPSPADRIRQARRANQPGIFHDKQPAALLFASFEHPARFVTLLHFTENLGIPVNQSMLTPVKTEPIVKAAPMTAPVGATDLESYFFGMLPLMLPVRLELPVSLDFEQGTSELQQLFAQLHQVSGEMASVKRQADEAAQKLIYARAAQCLMSGGLAVDPALFGKTEATPEAATAAEKEAAAVRQSLKHSIAEVSKAMIRRLELSLALGSTQDSSPSSPVATLVADLNASAEKFAPHRELADALGVLGDIKGVKSARRGSMALAKAEERQMHVVYSLFVRLNDQAAPNAPEQKSSLRLQQAAGGPSLPEGQSLASIEQTTHDWFTAYRRRLEELVRHGVAFEKNTT